MTGPKTLTEAREQLEAVNAQLAELQEVIDGHEAILEAFGMKRIVHDDGATHYESTFIQERDAQIIELRKSVETLESEKATAIEANKQWAEASSLASKRITELELSQKTAETRAREMVGSLGGPPLAVDASDGAELTAEVLRTQLLTEKDPNAQYALYKKIKAQEAKAKINGHHRR